MSRSYWLTVIAVLGASGLRYWERCLSSPEEIRAALEEAEAELHECYRKVWPLREAYAAAVPPAALPSRRNRTDKQALIARCPRCGGRISEDAAGQG
jgi:hypothetical protein